MNDQGISSARDEQRMFVSSALLLADIAARLQTSLARFDVLIAHGLLVTNADIRAVLMRVIAALAGAECELLRVAVEPPSQQAGRVSI